MAKRKLQMTAFARFFLFIIIFVPALFFGVTYFKGEDPMQTINEFLGRETTEEPASNNSSDSRSSSDDATLESAKVRQLQDELLDKERKLEELYRENERLKKDANDARREADDAMLKLKSIREAAGLGG